MSQDVVSAVVAELWSDFEGHGDGTFRPLLAHYTSVSTLERIIANDEVWLSNPMYMNDLEELRFGMNEGAFAFRDNARLMSACSDANHAALMGHFDRLFKDFDLNHAFDTYVMCLSEHDPKDDDGVLSMWRGYGASGGGVAIVFDTSKYTPIDSSPLIIGKVVYASTQERRAWLESKIDGIAAVLLGAPLTDEQLFGVAHYWLERVKIFALLTKHRGFREENEWRIFYLSQRDPQRLFRPMLGYAITPRGVEPKLKLKIAPLEGAIAEDVSLQNLIHRIILGPSISTVLAATSVKRVLELNGKAQLAAKVVASSIPFRP